MRSSPWPVSETPQQMMLGAYVAVVTLPKSHTGARTVYLRVYRLKEDTSGESPFTKRLRELRALHYEDYIADDEYDERRSFLLDPSLALPDEWMQVNHLRPALIRSPRKKAGGRWLRRFLVAVGIVINLGLVISGVVYWLNV